MSLIQLAEEIHAAAVKKGFWDVDMAVDKHVAKLRGELGEAIQEDRCGRPMLYVDDIEVCERITDPAMFDGRKPEGVAAELADFVMMMLDWMQESHEESVMITAEFTAPQPMRDVLRGTHFVQLINSLYHSVEAVCCGKDTPAGEFYSAMIFSVYGPALWLEERGIDIWEVVRLKMAYNASRPALHGRLY